MRLLLIGVELDVMLFIDTLFCAIRQVVDMGFNKNRMRILALMQRRDNLKSLRKWRAN